MSLWIPVTLTFASVMAVLFSFYHLATRQRREIIEKVKNQTQHPSLLKTERELKEHLKLLLQRISKIFAARGFAVKVEVKLIKAGIPLKGEEAVTLWLLLAFAPAGLVLILLQDPALAFLAVIAFIFLPFLFVNSMISKRLRKFDHQIGSALVIMANSLRAGFSFMQSLEMTAHEMSDPIASEFKRVMREIHLGTPVEQAMTNLSRRVGSQDMDLVVTAVLIQRQIGGNLAEVLDSISETIRERIRIAGEVKTLTAQGKISGMIIGLLPVVLGVLLFVINREYVGALFTDPRGLMLVLLGLISQVVGLIFIARIVNIRL